MEIKMLNKVNIKLEQTKKLINEINDILIEMELSRIEINRDIDCFLKNYKNTQNLVIASNKTIKN